MAENERFDPDGQFLDDDDNCAERRGSDDNASSITSLPFREIADLREEAYSH